MLREGCEFACGADGGPPSYCAGGAGVAGKIPTCVLPTITRDDNIDITAFWVLRLARYVGDTGDDAALRDAPYNVLRDWARMYDGNLLVVLPDCFGTTAFLEQAPDWVADWKGARPDSKSPLPASRELIAWWKSRGRDPREKLVVLSDAMDIDTIEEAVRGLRGQINVSIGWGTNLTNDFKGCAPAGVDGELRAISLVCKVVSVEGRPAIKLSDNPNKALGPSDEIERYRRVFGAQGMASQPVAI